MELSAEVIDQLLAGEVTFQEVIGVDPGLADWMAYLGSQMYEQGCYDAARQLFEGAMGLNCKSYLGYAGLGVLALNEDRLDESIGHLSKAYHLNTNDPAVCGNLGEAYLRKGDMDQAVRYLRESAALDPEQTNQFANRSRGMLSALQ
jgi:tetratricopeptide (TPR) repeat protein